MEADSGNGYAPGLGHALDDNDDDDDDDIVDERSLVTILLVNCEPVQVVVWSG